MKYYRVIQKEHAPSKVDSLEKIEILGLFLYHTSRYQAIIY